MKLHIYLLTLITFISSQNYAQKLEPFSRTPHEIRLTGFSLTIEDIVSIANDKKYVTIDPAAWKRVNQSHELLLKAAREDKPVYGLNRGVGLNKDKSIFEGDALSAEAREASVLFNKNNLYATSSAAGPSMPQKVVLAILLVKLNSILQGTTGAQPKIAELLAAFINNRVLPILPSRGSIGESDITILAHLGLTMMGEGEVYFEGEKMETKEAFSRLGLTPLVPFAKDSLSIMSSNAYSSALAALLIHDSEQLLNKSELVFSLSLEGLNGNIAPFLEEVQNARPYPGQKESASQIRQALKGSSLWETSKERELQDPLSFRNVSQVHGTAREIVMRAKEKLLLHLNSSDDNPVTILHPQINPKSSQEKNYYLKDASGAVIPTANFDTINWVIDFESLAIALSHVSHLSTQRMLRLSSEKFTHLTRFLSPNPESIVFGAIQKTFISLNTEIRSLSMPISFDSMPVAGEVEDHATNTPLILQRTCKILDNLYYIFGLELMHGTQAVNLRKQQHPEFQIGCITHEVFKAYRLKVPFIDKDRSLSEDIEKSHDFLAGYWSPRIVTPDCLFIEEK